MFLLDRAMQQRVIYYYFALKIKPNESFFAIHDKKKESEEIQIYFFSVSSQ